MVSVTGCCNVVYPWASILIAIIGSLVYSLACYLTNKYKIDDPLEAFQVHGCCGAWGLIARAIFDFEKGIIYGHADSIRLLGA